MVPGVGAEMVKHPTTTSFDRMVTLTGDDVNVDVAMVRVFRELSDIRLLASGDFVESEPIHA